MEKNQRKTVEKRARRAQRVRFHIRGNGSRPRMCVVKTNRHIFVQLIDDEQGKSVAASSTLAKEFKGTPYTRKNKESAKAIGENIAEKAKSLGINRVIFDRGPFKFHGILAELANAARASGLQF